MGKAQPLDAKVLTPWGFVPMGTLAVGDEITGRHGGTTKITGVHPRGELQVYRVRFSDGTSTRCCADHLWFTQTRNERRRGCPGSVKSLKEIMQTLSRADSDSPNHIVPLVEPIQYAAKPTLKLDPYVMGMLLGDGSFSQMVGFCNPEEDLQKAMAVRLPHGDTLTIEPSLKGCRVRKAVHGPARSATKEAIVYYGLDGRDSSRKFIPADYLYASIADRRALLMGLFDTDGWVCDSGQSVEYSTSSPALSEDVANLARSLGAIVSVAKRIPYYAYKGERLPGAESFRLVISFPDGYCPVGSWKHRAKWKGGKVRYHKAIAAVESEGVEACQCITVDAPDSLYVTDDFIVTHNSAVALNIAEHASFVGGYRTLFVSLEMGRTQLATRVLMSQAKIDGHKLQTGKPLTPSELSRFFDARHHVRERGRLRIDESPSRTVAQIGANARREKARHGLDLLVIDYLQLLETSAGMAHNARRDEKVGDQTRRLKGLARELDIPIILLSQLNRCAEGREDHRPRMADLRDSGNIEQDADKILLVHRPEYYDPDDQPGIAELIVAKNRNGQTGTAKLVYLKQFTRFETLAATHEMDTPNF